MREKGGLGKFQSSAYGYLIFPTPFIEEIAFLLHMLFDICKQLLSIPVYDAVLVIMPL